MGGTVIAEGKTKCVVPTEDEVVVRLMSKDDITAKDGARRDILPGKGAWSTTTTCNVFKLLQARGIPVAFRGQYDETSFHADRCDMIPLEVIVRREAHGSILKRIPTLKQGECFDELVTEFFLKTNGGKWGNLDLPCDDPLIEFDFFDGTVDILHPAQPGVISSAAIQMSKIFSDVWTDSIENKYCSMHHLAREAFGLLELAWADLGYTLVDFKVEFGITADGRLVIADVLDNDSWRLLKNGEYMDKQIFREGNELDPELLAKVAANYAEIAEMSEKLK